MSGLGRRARMLAEGNQDAHAQPASLIRNFLLARCHPSSHPPLGILVLFQLSGQTFTRYHQLCSEPANVHQVSAGMNTHTGQPKLKCILLTSCCLTEARRSMAIKHLHWGCCWQRGLHLLQCQYGIVNHALALYRICAMPRHHLGQGMAKGCLWLHE